MMMVAALASVFLAGCQVNLTTDRVTAKLHVDAAIGDVENTPENESECKIKWGTFTVSRNNPDKAVCRIDEQWLIEHGRKGQGGKWEEVTQSYYNAVHVGDKWKG